MRVSYRDLIASYLKINERACTSALQGPQNLLTNKTCNQLSDCATYRAHDYNLYLNILHIQRVDACSHVELIPCARQCLLLVKLFAMQTQGHSQDTMYMLCRGCNSCCSHAHEHCRVRLQ